MTSSSSESKEETSEKIQIEHIHHDPLMFFENVEGQPRCKICNELIIDGPMYGCIRCSFYVHNSCAELPKQVRNMFHPKHLLQLSREHKSSCNACNLCFLGFCYRCKLCDFELHIRCVLECTFDEPQGHKEHTFKISKPFQFTCDACGIEEVNSCICLCTICQLQVHKNCINTYSFIIKEPRHIHFLKLTYSFQTNLAFSDKICKVCFRKMNDVLFMYCCIDCDYFTHVKCGVSANTLHNDGHVLEIEDKVFGPNTIESKETSQQLVEHFSHPHSLILNINGPNSVILCNGCVRPISEPIYGCNQCSFFLHRNCVELKEKIQHPLHTHELTLVSVWDDVTRFLDFFRSANIKCARTGIECYGCGFDCNGFMYECEKCEFFLDVGCSLIPDRLDLDISRHEGHKCTLTLIDMYERHNGCFSDYETKCNACGLNCYNKFVCERCNFNLDLQCVSLPKLIPHQCPKHDWNLHPFELMYYAVEDGRSGEFYCDVCEEERSESHWFYYCQDCDYSAHPRCILGYDRIKYGSLYKLKNHPHIVCFSRIGDGNPACKKCLQPCKKGVPGFTCKECDAHFHYSCFATAEQIE